MDTHELEFGDSGGIGVNSYCYPSESCFLSKKFLRLHSYVVEIEEIPQVGTRLEKSAFIRVIRGKIFGCGSAGLCSFVVNALLSWDRKRGGEFGR